MDQGSATIHDFHFNHLHSPTHPRSLGSVRSDLTSMAAAAATMMHSAAAEMLVISQGSSLVDMTEPAIERVPETTVVTEQVEAEALVSSLCTYILWEH